MLQGVKSQAGKAVRHRRFSNLSSLAMLALAGTQVLHMSLMDVTENTCDDARVHIAQAIALCRVEVWQAH